MIKKSKKRKYILMKWLIKIFKRPRTIPVVRLDGVIGSSGQFGSGGLEDSGLSSVLEKAFSFSRAKAIALIVNSPGGSPTQSSLIASRVRRLSDEKNLPVFCFCEDVAASGGYWLACAGDEIYANENSIIGSIGVISSGFGFYEFISKQGIERRIYTSGKEKSMLDPFKPEQKSDVARLKLIQKAIHHNFKTYVELRRGNKVQDKNIFTGEFWEARRALELGLIDGLGNLETVLRDKYGENIEFKYVSRKKPLIARLSRSFSDSIISTVMNRIYFSRYNL